MNERGLERLDTMLATVPDACEPMLVSELDGFLAGVIVSPDHIPPGEWLCPILGLEDESEMPVFDSPAALQKLVDAIMRHQNDIVDGLMAAPAYYAPVLMSDQRTGETFWEMWADGFGAAMALRPEAWSQIIRSGDVEAIAALAGLTTLVERSRGEGAIASRELDDEALDQIGEWVCTLNYWRLENFPDSARVSPAKAGRNAPCPCGSGKKYKKCCGLN
jgi:uncharacterized protein